MDEAKPTGGAEGWRILGFGRQPEVAAAVQAQLQSAGLRAKAFALSDDPDGDARLASELHEATVGHDLAALGRQLTGAHLRELR